MSDPTIRPVGHHPRGLPRILRFPTGYARNRRALSVVVAETAITTAEKTTTPEWLWPRPRSFDHPSAILHAILPPIHWGTIRETHVLRGSRVAVRPMPAVCRRNHRGECRRACPAGPLHRSWFWSALSREHWPARLTVADSWRSRLESFDSRESDFRWSGSPGSGSQWFGSGWRGALATMHRATASAAAAGWPRLVSLLAFGWSGFAAAAQSRSAPAEVRFASAGWSGFAAAARSSSAPGQVRFASATVLPARAASG